MKSKRIRRAVLLKTAATQLCEQSLASALSTQACQFAELISDGIPIPQCGLKTGKSLLNLITSTTLQEFAKSKVTVERPNAL